MFICQYRMIFFTKAVLSFLFNNVFAVISPDLWEPWKFYEIPLQKIFSWRRRPKTTLEITKKPHFSWQSIYLLIANFSTILLTTKTKLKGDWLLVIDLSSAFLNSGVTYKTFQQPKKQNSFKNTYWKVVWKFRFTVLQNHHCTEIQAKQRALEESRIN